MTDHRTESQKDRDERGMVLFNGQEIRRETYDRIRGVVPNTTLTLGVPYASVSVEGSTLVRTCPVCGKTFADETDDYGEQTTNRYAVHYSAAHSA